MEILLATSRMTIYVAYVSAGEHITPPWTVTCIRVTSEALRAHGDLAAKDVAVIDAVDSAAAVRVCQELGERRPSLSVVAMVCCPQTLSPEELQALLATGIKGVIDLEPGRRGLAEVLNNVLQGTPVVRARLPPTGGGVAAALQSTKSPDAPSLAEREQVVLRRLAQGLTAPQIAELERFSPRTVSRIVSTLERKLDAQSLFQLGATADRLGLLR